MAAPFGQIWGQRRDHAIEGVPWRCHTASKSSHIAHSTSMAPENCLRQKKSIPGILGGGGCDHAIAAVGVPWTCRELCDCFSMLYGTSTAPHGHASGPKFAQMAQPYRGDTVEGVVDLWDRGISDNSHALILKACITARIQILFIKHKCTNLVKT